MCLSHSVPHSGTSLFSNADGQWQRRHAPGARRLLPSHRGRSPGGHGGNSSSSGRCPGAAAAAEPGGLRGGRRSGGNGGSGSACGSSSACAHQEAGGAAADGGGAGQCHRYGGSCGCRGVHNCCHSTTAPPFLRAILHRRWLPLSSIPAARPQPPASAALLLLLPSPARL